MAAAKPLSPVIEDEMSETPSTQRTDWEKVTDPRQLKVGRRTAKSAHTFARKAIAECVQRRGNASEFRILLDRIQREFELVIKRHRRYLEYAKIEKEDLEEQANWLRLVKEDHEKAVNLIPLRIEVPEPNAHSRPATPAVPPAHADVHLLADADAERDQIDEELDVLEIEQPAQQPKRMPSVSSCLYRAYEAL